MLNKGEIYSTKNFGDLYIIKYINCRKVIVKFLATGYKTVARKDHILNGQVKDKFTKTIYNIGYIGEGPEPVWLNGKHNPLYSTWSGMIQRCYCEQFLEKRPSYVGCKVFSDWLNFQEFAKWCRLTYPNKSSPCDGEYQLDKDILYNGNRLYSPYTCLWVTQKDNTIKANAKHYKFISPLGETVSIYNLTAFCREHNLNQSDMSAVYLGKRHHAKGWTKCKEK